MLLRLVIAGALYSWIAYIVILTMRRAALTTALLEKYQHDEIHKSENHQHWYQLAPEKLDERLRDRFVPLAEDDETKAFLLNCYEKSDALLWQLWHSVAIPVLKMFMTQTNVNGYLGRGSMFVFSSAQFKRLMGIKEKWTGKSLLDLGAGDGKVTQIMAGNFEIVHATEASTQMQRHLRDKGYTILGIDEWPEGHYDVISCLNLLDRCDKPMTLLNNIHSAMNADGFLIVASVYPYSPYVEGNSQSDYQPTEKLPVSCNSIEEQVNQMVDKLFIPCGFELVRFTRLPYLCEGDLTTSFYVLHDIVFVLRHKKL